MYGFYYTHLSRIAQAPFGRRFQPALHFSGYTEKPEPRRRFGDKGKAYSRVALSVTGSVIFSPELTLTVRTTDMPVPSSVRVRVTWSTNAICG